MNKKDKDEFTTIVTDALNDVMIPALESLETRLTDKLASKEDLDRVERKIIAATNRMDRHGKQIEDYGERIQTLETASL